MSFVFFAALVGSGGRPGHFLRFSGGPVGGLVVRRFLTWVHCCSSSTVGCWQLQLAWAGAGAARTGATGARLESWLGLGLGLGWAETGTGNKWVFCYMLVLHLLHALLAMGNQGGG